MPTSELQLSPGALLAFLENPTSYPHSPERVSIIQTHTSYVAIAPPYVYKVKKPVDFSFLDFSTLAKRRHYCEVEVTLNRRLCAGIYEGVVPLSQENGSLSFGSNGRVVDYAIKMKQLADGGFLKQRLARHDVAPEDLDRVIAKLEPFYRAQTSTPDIAQWGWTDKLKLSTDENFAQTEHVVGRLLSRPAFEAIRYYTNGCYEHQALLFSRRRAEGRILDCHGDLHLEHIHLTPAAVCIYDCIEFNERFRYIDIANDLAFLAMDLDFHGRPELAQHLVGRTAEVLDDPGMLELIDFYQCYRAYVRGKVEGMRGEQPEVLAAEREASRARARHYYQLALRYAACGSKPAVVVLMGQVGTGKTTQAEALAEAFGWVLFSSDRVRKELAGVPLYERGDAAARSILYAKEMTARTYAALRDGALAGAREGRGVLLDATYGNSDHRRALREALECEGVPGYFVELTAPDDALKRRLAQRADGMDVISDARLEDFAALSAHYEAPDALEDARHVMVDTGTRSADEATLEILKAFMQLSWGARHETAR